MKSLDEGMSWWRVAMDRDGSVHSCEQIELVATPGRVVGYVYVQANDRAAAVAKARAWYERRKEIRRKADQKRSAARKAKGMCRDCPAKVCAESMLYCAEHLARHREAVRRHDRGETRHPRPNPIAAMKHDQKRRKLYQHQMMHLGRVLQKFDDLGPSGFRVWLVTEIEKRGGTVHMAEAAE